MDYSSLISDFAKELTVKLDQAAEGADSSFERGRKFGLAEAASLLIQETQAFGIEPHEVGLEVFLNRGDIIL